MLDHTSSLLSRIGQALGVPLGAIPLSYCKITRSYLLERNSIGADGTVIIFAVPYVMTEDAIAADRNVSLYAVGEDYHHYFQILHDALIHDLEAEFPTYHFALFSDHSPIYEVEAAALCGLGLIGDHGLLITPAYGSFVFIGEIVTDMPWEAVTGQDDFQPRTEIPHCHHCGACQKACPGNCLPGHRITCVSAISQKKGVLSDEEQALLLAQPLVWGCDVCQLVCPYNQEVIAQKLDTPIAYFRENRIRHIDRQIIADMSDEMFRRRAYAWRGKAVIERNLILWEERRKSCSN